MPSEDCEFTASDHQGEQDRMDLLTVLAHEIGRLLGYDHVQTGVMDDALVADTLRLPSAGNETDWLAAIDLLLAEPSLNKRRW